MKKSRLMNTPADYKSLGVNPNKIEVWEDGRRDDSRPGAWEWWYFDMLLDDGTKVVVTVLDKDPATPEAPLSPYIRLEIALPSGEQFFEQMKVNADDCFLSTEKCDIRFGPHTIKGDLKRYEIHLSTENGFGADLVLENMISSWRPGSSYIGFGDKDEDYFTWLCSVPRGKVSGQLTVKNETRDVKGFGYHDHQWGTVSPLRAWNHWFWIRQTTDDYTILIFDFTANFEYNFKRYPLVFVQDANGKIIFESFGDIEESKLEIESEYKQELTGKDLPHAFTYTFKDGDKSVVYSMESIEEILAENYYSEDTPPEQKEIFDKLKAKPSYTRWVGHGKFKIDIDGVTSEQESNAIYEMIFNGTNYKIH